MRTKVLVIDDEQGMRDLISMELNTLGYDVITASNGEDGVRKIKEDKFVMVITDIKMPGLTGDAVLEEIKRIHPDTEVIMITGNGTMETAVKTLKAGAFDFVTKPFNIDDLVVVVNKAHEKYRLKKAATVGQTTIYITVATDVQGNIKRANKTVSDILGYDENELIGFPMKDLFTAPFWENEWSELEKKDKVQDFPLEFLSKDGIAVRTLFTGTVIKDGHGGIVALLGTGRK